MFLLLDQLSINNHETLALITGSGGEPACSDGDRKEQRPPENWQSIINLARQATGTVVCFEDTRS